MRRVHERYRATAPDLMKRFASFVGPAAVILKHNNPCGASVADSLADAFERAYDAVQVLPPADG